jgi:hypothetical protein
VPLLNATQISRLFYPKRDSKCCVRESRSWAGRADWGCHAHCRRYRGWLEGYGRSAAGHCRTGEPEPSHSTTRAPFAGPTSRHDSRGARCSTRTRHEDNKARGINRHCDCATCQQTLHVRIIIPHNVFLEDNTSSAGIPAALVPGHWHVLTSHDAQSGAPWTLLTSAKLPAWSKTTRMAGLSE